MSAKHLPSQPASAESMKTPLLKHSSYLHTQLQINLHWVPLQRVRLLRAHMYNELIFFSEKKKTLLIDINV